jgi:hypothetical protein
LIVWNAAVYDTQVEPDTAIVYSAAPSLSWISWATSDTVGRFAATGARPVFGSVPTNAPGSNLLNDPTGVAAISRADVIHQHRIDMKPVGDEGARRSLRELAMIFLRLFAVRTDIEVHQLTNDRRATPCRFNNKAPDAPQPQESDFLMHRSPRPANNCCVEGPQPCQIGQLSGCGCWLDPEQGAMHMECRRPK